MKQVRRETHTYLGMDDVVGGRSDFEGVVLEREGEEEEESVGFWRPEVFVDALAGAGERGERE